jgi:exonuclease III
VCSIYRPPSTNKYLFVKELGRYVERFSSSQNLILVGDANIDLKTISSHKDSYLETLSGQGLMCGITDFTRIETRLNVVSKTCIDHIFTRFPTLVPYTAVFRLSTGRPSGCYFGLHCRDGGGARACTGLSETYF